MLEFAFVVSKVVITGLLQPLPYNMDRRCFQIVLNTETLLDQLSFLNSVFAHDSDQTFTPLNVSKYCSSKGNFLLAAGNPFMAHVALSTAIRLLDIISLLTGIGLLSI